MRDLRPSSPLGARTGPLRWRGRGREAEWRGAGGRPDARGDGLCPLWRVSRRRRVGVGASAVPCWFVSRHWRLCRAAYTPPKPMVTLTLTRQHAGPSPEPPIGRSHGTATLEPPTAFAAGRRLLATWTRTMMSEEPDCLCRTTTPSNSLCVFSSASLRDDGSRLGHFVYLASVFRLPHAQRWGLLPCLARESVGHGLLVEAPAHARRSPGSICALVH